MKKNAMYYITIILTILFVLVNTYSYAAEITKEDLKEYFKNLEKQEDITVTGKTNVTDEEIIVIDENGQQFNIKYDLSDKPTFSTEAVFKDGETYDETINEEENIIYPLIGFMATANIYGEDESEAFFYTMFSLSGHMEEVELGKIEESEFTNAIDYAQKRYGKDIIIKDDLYTLNIKKGILKEGEYTVNVECIVPLREEFIKIIENKENATNNTIANSIIGGLENSIGSMTNQIISVTNTVTNNTTNSTATTTPTIQPTKTPSIANIGKMPNAGFELNILNILKIVLGLSLAGVIVYSIYSKRYSSK